MYFLGSFKKEARTLWHGTSSAAAKSIMREGLIPSVGQWTESAYGGDRGWGTGGLLDTSFAADKEELSRAMGGIAAQVAGMLGKDFNEVTDEEFMEYGALIKVTEGDREMEHYHPGNEGVQYFPQSQSEPTIRTRQDSDYDPDSDEFPLIDEYEEERIQEELKPNAPAVSRHVEPGDWFTREEIPPERLSALTGKKMIDVFRRAGLWPRMWGPSREDNVAKQWVAYQMRNHYDEWVDQMEEEAEELDEEFEEPTRQEVATYLMDYSSNFDLETLRKQIPTSLGLFERGRDYAYGDDMPDEGMEDDFMDDPRESPNHYRRKRHRNSSIEEFKRFANLIIEVQSDFFNPEEDDLYELMQGLGDFEQGKTQLSEEDQAKFMGDMSSVLKDLISENPEESKAPQVPEQIQDVRDEELADDIYGKGAMEELHELSDREIPEEQKRKVEKNFRLSRLINDFERFAELIIEAAPLDPKVKAIRDQIMPWAGKKAKIYATWLHKHSKKGEPLEDIMPLAKFHAENLNRLRGPEADINSFKTPGDLQKFLDDKFSEKKDEKYTSHPVDVVDGWEIHFPQSEEESIGFDSGDTTWCTVRQTGENLFYNYALGGINLIYVKSPNGKKYSVGYLNGEMIASEHGGTTVQADNEPYYPEEVFPDNVRNVLDKLGSTENKVKNDVIQKLKTPEGIDSLFKGKRFDASKNLLLTIEKKLGYEHIDPNKEYLTKIFYDKIQKNLKTTNISKLDKNFLRIESDIDQRLRQKQKTFDLNQIIPIDNNELGISIFNFDISRLPLLTQKSIYEYIKNNVNLELLKENPDLISNKNLARLANIDIEEYIEDIKEEVRRNPNKHLKGYTLEENDIYQIFDVANQDYDFSNAVMSVIKSSPKETKEDFFNSIKDQKKLFVENINSKVIVENLGDLYVDYPPQEREYYKYSLFEELPIDIAYLLLSKTNTSLKDVEKMFDKITQSKSNITTYSDEEEKMYDLHNFRQNLYKNLFYRVTRLGVDKINPDAQEEMMRKTHIDIWDERNNPRYYEETEWVSPEKLPPDIDFWHTPYKSLRRERMEFPEEHRKEINERIQKRREEQQVKDKLHSNVPDYEEDWLDDRLVANFEEFAQGVIYT